MPTFKVMRLVFTLKMSFEVFGHIWAFQSFWSRDKDNSYKFMSPHVSYTWNLDLNKHALSEKMFENNGDIHNNI